MRTPQWPTITCCRRRSCGREQVAKRVYCVLHSPWPPEQSIRFGSAACFGLPHLDPQRQGVVVKLSLIHISEPTRLALI
eukprot:7627107-Alexandrium_andersonii.AAC.1